MNAGPPQRAPNGADNPKSLDNRRLIRCPKCGHQGTVGKHLKTTVHLVCNACKLRVMLRFCIVGENGSCCRWRPRSAAKTLKDTAARDVMKRYGGDVPDDRLDDLWIAG